MPHPRRALEWAATTLLLATVHFLSGALCSLLSIPLGHTRAVWPPSGLALVGLLVLGKRHWPGVFLGSFLLNLELSFRVLDPSRVTSPLLVAASIALGAAAQASTGAWLIRRHVGWPQPLIRSRKILSFMLLGGPLSCLIGATWGAATLWIAGIVPVRELAANWGEWWVGDTLGTWIFSIIGLVALGQPREVWRPRRRSVALPLAASCAAAIAVFFFVQKSEAGRQRSTFIEKARAQVSRLALTTRTDEAVLHGLAALFDARENVTREQFHTYAKQALRMYGSFEGLAWIPRVPQDRRQVFEERARQEGFANFEIKDLTDGKLVRAQVRAEYFPALYVQRNEEDDQPTGFDVASEAARRTALEQARDIGADQATVPVEFLRKKGRGIVVTVPVYDMAGLNETLRSVDETTRTSQASIVLRRHRLRGYVVGGLLLEHVKNEALDKTAVPDMQLYVEDVTDSQTPVFVFSRGLDSHIQTAPPTTPLDWSTHIRIGERMWQMRFIPTPAFQATRYSPVSWFILSGGFLFTSLLGGVLLVITGGTTLVEQRVVERTAELTALNRELAGEVAERRRAEEQLTLSEGRFRNAIDYSAIGFALVDPDGRWLQANAALCRTLSVSADELLQRSVDSVTHPDDVARDRALTEDLLAGRITHFHTEKRYLREDRAIVWALTSVSLVRRADGSPLHMVSQIQDITERKRADLSLQASLEEKEVLLREVHHRVKNNMQVISSLLNLHSMAADRPEEEKIFRECQLRIQAMAMIHDRLYHSPSLATIDFGEHLIDLATLVVRSNPRGGARVEMKTDCAHVELPLDTAIPLGLIATELVSNACKHAFHGRESGELRVELLTPAPGSLVLCVSDDGPGLPEGFDLRKAKSLGLRLIDNLTRQLRGGIVMNRNGRGARIEITLPSPAISSKQIVPPPHANAA